MNRVKSLLESNNLSLYKTMLNVFSEYCTDTPCTGVDKMFDTLVENGAKILPKDKLALEILNYIFTRLESPGVQIHKFLNIRFSDLPVNLRPRFRSGRKLEVANWVTNNVVSDRVSDLINWSNSGTGFWSDISGNKQNVINNNN